MSESIRVLHVEDDADFAALTAEYVQRVDEALTVERVACREAATERLGGPGIDCVVSDFDLPESDGIALLEEVRQVDDRLPFILFTGKGSEEVASDALAAGATDYLQKERGADQFTVLANRIENAVARHRAVKALERQNDRHEKAEEIANLGTWELDPRTDEVWLSAGAYRTLGLPADYEPTLRSGLAHYHPDDRRAVVGAVVEAVERQETVDIEARYVGGAGGDQWVRVRGDPQFEDGEVVRLRATIQDVTRHKEREAELERYETVVQAAGDPVYTLDAAGRFRFVNDAMLDETDYSRDELLGSHVSLCVDDADMERGREVVRTLFEDDERRRGTVEIEVVGRDGTRERCEVNVALLPAEDGVAGTVGVVRSVEDCKRRERERRRYEAIVETVPVGVLCLDADGDLVEGNVRAESILGLDRDAWIGEPFETLVERGVVPRDAHDELVESLCELLAGTADTDVLGLETEISPPDADESRLVTGHVTLLPDDCEFEGAVGIVRDVTERRAHEQAPESETTRLELAGRDGTEEYEHLERVADALGRVTANIDDTLALTRLGEGVDSPARVDLEPIARRAWPEESEAVLRIPDDVTVEGDSGRLRIALANLFANAVVHGPERVTVRLGASDDGGFYVADDGPGIPAEDRDRIFEPGYTTERQGTGFGLAVVERVAAAHGWEVSVGESVDGGARFEFAPAGSLP